MAKPAKAETKFTGNFTQQEPIPEAGIEAALRVLRHGRLHRYNVVPGEDAEAALLEQVLDRLRQQLPTLIDDVLNEQLALTEDSSDESY